MQSTPTIIESQADWLTVTCNDPDYIPSFRAWAKRAVSWEQAAGNKSRDVAILGYVGVTCGRVRWGARADGDLVMLSGDAATKELSRALQYGTHVTRLDLAVTVHLDPEDLDVEHRHYTEFLASEYKEGRRPRATVILSSDNGATFYLGRRTSNVMLRVYNKAVESRDAYYFRCHRYELEVKGDRASVTATQLDQCKDPARFCQEAVYDWAARRGITPVFASIGGRQLVPGFKRRSDVDSKLAWLENQVRPSVAWLAATGHRKETLAALDVDPSEAAEAKNSLQPEDAGYWPDEGATQ